MAGVDVAPGPLPSFLQCLLPMIPSVPFRQERHTVFPLWSPRCSPTTDRLSLPPQFLSAPHLLTFSEIILPICYYCLLCISPVVPGSLSPLSPEHGLVPYRCRKDNGEHLSF